jgi:hypothetical protein
MEKNFPVGQIKSALLAMENKISDEQKAMLRGFYLHRVASMEIIASFGGYRTYNAGNGIFGRLCRLIADELGFVSESRELYNRFRLGGIRFTRAFSVAFR